MIITPLGTMGPKRYALLEPGWRRMICYVDDQVWVCNGVQAVEQALSDLSSRILYVSQSLSMLRHTTGALSWTLSTWRSRETRMVHGPTGATVTSLAGTLEGSTDPAGDLGVCLDWLHEFGVAPASLSSMAWNLWRATLPRPVTINADPAIGRAALFGGRQEISEPRDYSHMVSADIRAAYPFAMASAPYALSLREVSPETGLDGSLAGLARARVHVDSDMPYGPLPVRVAPQLIQFQRGTLHGIWPWKELLAARDLGADVIIEQSWAPKKSMDLFTGWWLLVQEGRNLPGRADIMAKSIFNRLWGQFGMVGDDRAEVRWADEAGEQSYRVPLEGRLMPHAWTAHIAAETTSRVRTRMLTEGLYGSRYRPVHVDTDGVILRRNAPVPGTGRVGFGEWRVKDRMAKVQVKAPQLYRWTCGKGCGVTHSKWHYVASGLTAAQAPEWFRKAGALRTSISYLASFDSCLPTAHSADRRRINQLLAEAQGLGVGA